MLVNFTTAMPEEFGTMLLRLDQIKNVPHILVNSSEESEETEESKLDKSYVL